MRWLRRSAHLVVRFFGAFAPFGPSRDERAWVDEILTTPERAVFARLGRADQREGIAVARRVRRALAPSPHADDPSVLAAALLHDVGKSDARLGPVGRAMATLAGALAGHEIADAWTVKGGIARRFGLYLRHGEVGAGILRVAGARESAAAWAAVHHLPERWSEVPFPPEVCMALALADGDRPLEPPTRNI